MKDIKEILENVLDNKSELFTMPYTLVVDTPSGVNISADEIGESVGIVWLNLIENSTITASSYDLNFPVTRTVEIVMFQDCIKEDTGSGYYPILQNMRADAGLIINGLTRELDMSNISMDTDVDELDRNMCMLRLQFTFDDVIDNSCDKY